MSAYVPADLRRQVRALYGECCAYCRTAGALTVVTFEVEHIEPRAGGGETILENLCLACPTCNRFKSIRVELLDPYAGEKVAIFNPHTDSWSAHFAWSDDATEIIPLSPTGRATLTALRLNRSQLIRLRRMWVLMGEHPPKHK